MRLLCVVGIHDWKLASECWSMIKDKESEIKSEMVKESFYWCTGCDAEKTKKSEFAVTKKEVVKAIHFEGEDENTTDK